MKKRMTKDLKFFLFVAFWCSVTAFSQDLSVKYSFIKNGLSIKDYNLDIQKDHSLFYDSEYCLDNINIKSQLIILKDNSSEIKVLDKAGDVSVSTRKQIQLNWSIINETKIIENYTCQKAKVIYGNQKWIVWFTNDLPFQDGPFVFKGLPGLILMAESEKYKFELLEINKSLNHQCSIEEEDRKEISYDKYQSLFDNITKKNNNLLNSISNLGLKLETDFRSMSEKETKNNVIRELL